MDNTCTACLCSGRNLYFITETSFYNVYTNILNEIPVYDITELCIRICWECRAMLHRFHVFKQRVKQSHTELLQYLRQPNRPEFPPTNPPNLQIHSQPSTSYPEVKLELPTDFYDPVKIENEDGYTRDENQEHGFVRDESEQPGILRSEIEEQSYVQNDSTNTNHVENFVQEVEDTHREPMTFVNNLVVVGNLRLEKRCGKLSTRKTKTPKVKKQKEKSSKKTKTKTMKNYVKIDENNASDFDDNAHFDEDSKEVEKEDIPENSTESKELICGVCSYVSADKEELDRHTEETHLDEGGLDLLRNAGSDPGLLVGRLNQVQVQTAERVALLQKHAKIEPLKRVRVKEDLPDKPKCEECNKQFSSKKTYRYHRSVIHRGENQHPCPRCDKVFQWRSNLSRHLRSHKARDSGELNCKLCDKKFSSVATYRQHLKLSKKHINESDFSFVCNECGRKFITKTRLRDHIDWEHLHKIKFRCELCNKPFKCHTSLYMHRQSVHPAAGERRSHLCDVCGKCYTNPNKLKYHIVAMHTHETPYKCNLCDTAFRWYSSLYRHTREVHYKMRLQPNRYKGKKPRKEPLPPPEH